MSGYAFYCSKCKIDHAGECPPDPAPVTTLVPGQAVVLTVGSLWRPMITDLSTGNWVDTPFKYEITVLQPAQQRIGYVDVADPTRYVYYVDEKAWTDEGVELVGSKAQVQTPIPKVRFVPAAPKQHAWRMGLITALQWPYDCAFCGAHEDISVLSQYVGSPAIPALGPCPAIKP